MTQIPSIDAIRVELEVLKRLVGAFREIASVAQNIDQDAIGMRR